MAAFCFQPSAKGVTMNDCVLAPHTFLILYIGCVAVGCCPLTTAMVLGVAYASLSAIG